MVENIDHTSRQLREALEAGRTIIVTTLQKFPVIAEQIGELPGRRFAVIVDEAHSSQSGESTKSLRAVLAAGSLDEAEREEAGAQTPEEELDDRVHEEIRSRGRLPNLSTFAFTATPKPKTLVLFGRKRPEDGKFEPFHRYTMRQAIEERFILDVLGSYSTWKAYWRPLKTIEDDPRYDGGKAEYLLKSFVELHPHAIREKVAICVEHFAAQVAGAIDGRAKAMVVTRSRLPVPGADVCRRRPREALRLRPAPAPPAAGRPGRAAARGPGQHRHGIVPHPADEPRPHRAGTGGRGPRPRRKHWRIPRSTSPPDSARNDDCRA